MYHFTNNLQRAYLLRYFRVKRNRVDTCYYLPCRLTTSVTRGTRVTWFATALCSQIPSSRRLCTWGTTHCSAACSCSSTASFVHRLRNVPPSIWTQRSRVDNERTETRTCSTLYTFISTASPARVEVSHRFPSSTDSLCSFVVAARKQRLSSSFVN